MKTPVDRENDSYKLVELIGEGGMGNVYRAFDKKLGRDVAIKLLKKGLAEENNPLARFQREIWITSKFSHQNIVRVYALDEFDGSPCMVMEFLEGKSVAQLIKTRHSMTIFEKVKLFCQVCDGLQYAHERGVVHRDLKPANILVNSEVAKIVDFGIAREESDLTLTQTGLTIGTLYYMSPEQLSPGTPVDARTDIFSTGVTLYEFLTGELPFRAAGGDMMATMLKILNDPVPPLSTYLTHYPPALDEILRKSMAKRPDDRYRTIEEFGNDLATSQEGLKRGMTQELLSEAREAVERKDWEHARRVLQEIRNLDRLNPDANSLRKLVDLETEKQQAAVRLKILKSQAQNALAASRLEEAQECVAQALVLDPDDKEFAALGQTVKTKLEQARMLNEALSRCQAALFAGDLQTAALEAGKAIKVDGTSTEARAMEDLVQKGLRERERRARVQGFIDNARGKISGQDFEGALGLLEQASEVEPTDSNIRELRDWALRGYEKAKRSKELQSHIDQIGQLIKNALYEEALSASGRALKTFPAEAVLLQLQAHSKHQGELSSHRQAIDRFSAEAQKLVDVDHIEEAATVLQQALKQFPGDQYLETLLLIIRTEYEQLDQQKEEEVSWRGLIAGQGGGGSVPSSQEQVLALLHSFQRALSRKSSLKQLRAMAQRISTADNAQLLSDEEKHEFSIAHADLDWRAESLRTDCLALDEIYGSVRSDKESDEINALLRRAREILDEHPREKDIRERYRRIVRSANDLRLGREAVIAELSGLVRAMQARQQLPFLVAMRERVMELSTPWLAEPLVGDLANQASVYVQDAQRNQKLLLDELAQLAESVALATSTGQIRMLEGQARVLSVDLEDPAIEKAIVDLQKTAEDRLRRLDRINTQLKEIAAKTSIARSLGEAENYYEDAQKVSLSESSFEETQDLLRKIDQAVEQTRNEYRRISRGLESLILSAAQAAKSAELDLILAKRRDLLRKYPGDLQFSELSRRLEETIRDRREQLAKAAASETRTDEREDRNDGEANRTLISPSPLRSESVDRKAQAVRVAGEETPSKRLSRYLALGILCVTPLVGVGLYALLPRTVAFDTNPEGANVRVDQQSCNSPCSMRLHIGRHQITVYQAGFAEARPLIAVKWFGANNPVIALTALATLPSPPPVPPTPDDKTRIAVQSSVADALVFVDSSTSPIGRTDSRGRYDFPIAPGPHEVHLEKSGFQPSSIETVVAKQGIASPLRFKPDTDAKKLPSTSQSSVPPVPVPPAESTPQAVPDTYLVVRAPTDSEVRVDQQLAGQSKGLPMRIKVQPGQRTVDVFLHGYLPFSQAVIISPGAQQDLDVNLSLAQVKAVPAPTDTFTVTPENIVAGRIAQLVWETQNADDVTIDGEKVNANGSKSVSPSASRKFKLVAKGPGGTNQDEVFLNVRAEDVGKTSNNDAISDDDKAAIGKLLNRYAEIFSKRRAKSVREVWPTAPAAAINSIQSAIESTKAISVSIVPKKWEPHGTGILVTCQQTQSFERNGKQTNQSSAINFYMVKSQGAWVISDIPTSSD